MPESEAFSRRAREEDIKAEELRRLISDNEGRISEASSGLAVS